MARILSPNRQLGDRARDMISQWRTIRRKIVKVEESELPGDPRRFRITQEDIERIGFSDG